MHTPLRAARPNGRRWSVGPRAGNWLPRVLAALLLTLVGSSSAWAQLTGTKSIPGDYATLSAAITDLNTAGVGSGGVTFNVAAGYTETANGLLITTTTGSAANPIVFQKSGTGANPLITAGTGTSTSQDYVLGLLGADYVTFNGIDVADNAANTTATTQMEFGYALFRASATDGCQNVSISNATISLNKANTATVGIWGANTTATSTTAVTASAASGANSNIKLNGNTVSSFVGIYLTGNTSTAANADTGNEIGTTAGNTLTNLGGANTSVYGIRAEYQNGLKIENNTINIPVGNTGTTVRGIGTGAGTATGMTGSVLINNNTLTVASATSSTVWGINQAGTSGLSSVSITNNKVQNSVLTSSGSVYYIQDASSASGLTSTITGNQILGNSATTTGTVAGIYRSGTSGTATINNNVVGTAASGNTVTAAGTTFYGVQATTGTITFSGNSIVNNTITSTGSTSSTVYGYYNLGSPTSETLTNNTVTGLSIVGNGTATGHALGGIYTNSTSSAVKVISGNTVGNLTLGTSGATATGTLTGITQYLGTTLTVNQNKVYGLTAYGAATVNGILLGSGTTITAANNLVGSLTAPAATGLAAISGVQVAGGTTVNLYFNTIYVNATSTGATFGTSGIYLNSTSATLDARNNVVVNKSTAAGTGGYTAALRRVSGTAGTVPSNLATTTNNNLYYAGTPSATNVIYVEGTTTATNAQQTVAAYKGFVAPRESNSVTEDVSFLSTTGTDATFLHVNSATATQIESGGQPISGITTDYDGDTRNATTPDIGADEGSFTPQDLSGPTISYTALGNTASTTNRTLDVTITDASGVATGANAPRLYFRKGSSGAFVFVNATSVSGNVYTFTFDFALIGGVTGFDVVQYYVAAQDNAPAQNVSSTPVGASGNNPPGTAFTGTPSQFSIQGTLSGVYYVGSGTSPNPARTYPTLTAAVSAYNNNRLGGAVTFTLLDATYSTAETFPLVIGANADASATNTLTIKPNTGVTSAITGSVGTGALIKLNGADYVTIDGSNAAAGTSKDLTITNTSTATSGNAVVWLTAASATDGATNNVVRNVNVVGASATAPLMGIFMGGSTSVATGAAPLASNSNNAFTNNTIYKAAYGVYLYGVSATVLDQGNTISGNQIGQSTTANGLDLMGVLAQFQQGLTVTTNDVQNVIGTSATDRFGINLQSNKGATVSRNLVHDVRYNGTSVYAGYGIDVATGTFTTSANASANTVSNNVVYAVGAPLAGTSANPNAIGIGANGGYGDKFYYNTVYLNLAQTAGTGQSAAFANGNNAATTTSSNIDVQNNIFAVDVTATVAARYYAHFTKATTYTGSTLNNNDLFVRVSGSAVGKIGYFNSADVADLAAWRTATGQEANSISADPVFAQTTTAPYSLVPGNVQLNGTANPIAGITVDFTGATRSTTAPDMGAYEFTPPAVDVAPTALVSPATTSSCYGPAEAVTVTIRNAGSADLNFATNPATVTVVVTPPSGAAQTLTTTLNTGTLAVGASQNVTLSGTADLTVVGTYAFAVTATVTGDGNTGNDVLTPAATRTVTAPAAGTLTSNNSSLCVNGTAVLTLTGSANGSVQLQQSTDNVTFTDISGATGTTFTTSALAQTTYFRARTTCNTNVATSNVVTITVNNPQLTGTNSPQTICAGSTATITATAASGTNVRFFDVATGGTPLNTNTPGSYTTPALTANTTYYAEAYTGGTAVAGLADNSAANGTFSQATPTDYPLGFAVTQAGTLTSVDVYPTAAGTLTIRLYSVSGTQPAGTATAVPGSDVTITVTAAQVGTRVTVPLNYSLAPGDYKLSNFAGGLGRYSTYTGSYPLTSANGVLSVKGSYTFYYSTSYSNTTYNSFFNLSFSNECAGSPRTAIQVNVAQPATATLPATASSCGTSAVALTGAVGGSATGGTYTTSGTGTFAPDANTLNATYTPSAADLAAGTVTLTLTSTGGPCTAATATQTLTLTTPGVATFSYPTGTTYCAGSTSTITPTLGTGATAGTFSISPATGLSIDPVSGIISLTGSTAGTYTVTNTLAASGACAVVTATATVTVTPVTSAAFSYGAGTFCQSGSNPTPTVTGTQGGTFAGTSGLSIDPTSGAINLTATAPGTYTVTYSVGGSCPSSSTASVTITTAPVASFTYPNATTHCAGSTSTITPTLGTGASAGTFTVSPATGLSINATTGVISLAGSTAGTYTVTNSIAASGSCAAATATATVIITAPATAGFSYAATSYCTTGTNPTPTVTGTSGGTFTATTGLSINATTGVLNLTGSTPGTYTVTYTAGTSCPASSTATVTITAPATAGFSYSAASFCTSATTAATPTLATGATAGTFSSTTGLTLNATTGAITPSTSTPGTYTVTNTVAAAGGCAAVTSTATVTITAPATAGFSYPTTGGNCAGSTGTLAATLATGATAGTFTSTTGLTINATTGAINLSASTAGTYTVTNTVAAAGGCAVVTSTATVTINARPAQPTVTLQYTGPGSALLTSSAAPTGATYQWYLGTTAITGATSQTYAANGVTNPGAYTVVITSAQGCASVASAPITVTATSKPLTGSSLALFPNPTPDGKLLLELTGYSKAVELTVLDATGRVVYRHTVQPGQKQQQIDLSQVARGVYVLRAVTEGGTDTRRIVRE